jgi:type VI secretion system protein ImpH
MLAHYAAVAAPPSAEVMQAVLAEYFGARAPAAFAWRLVPARATGAHLARHHRMFGQGAAPCWVKCCRRADLRVRLILGPLARRAYEDFLPGRLGALALRHMLALFGLLRVSFEIRLVLRRRTTCAAACWAWARAGRGCFPGQRVAGPRP